MDDSLFTIALLPVALAIIMITLGLSLTPADFRRIFELPRGVLTDAVSGSGEPQRPSAPEPTLHPR